MVRDRSAEELVRKYKLAGKIRFISFSLLLLFLFLMKFIGGYSYLNMAFVALILVEAIANQPYYFILKRVDIRRFQYFQMMTDIIVITWVIHYMGGIEAPLISIAYYAVILWAGVVSTTQAVFFAVIASAVFFSSVVICEHFGILPFITYFNHRVPTPQMFSLLFGNLSFLFAFGYFSARSSDVMKLLQRKQQEESLAKVTKHLAQTEVSRDYLKNVIKTMTDPLIVVDPDKRIATINLATCYLLGYKEEELMGEKIEAIIAEPENSPLRGGKLQRLLGTGTIMNVEINYVSKDGRKIPVLFSSSVMKDKNERIIWIVCTAKDITEIKKAEQRLQAAYNKLKESQSQLIQAAKMEAVGRMASGVAHEVKNPLGVIMQGVEYLEAKLPRGDEKVSGIADMVKHNIERADDIIRSLVDFSRATELKTNPEDINSIVESSLLLVQHGIKMENIRIARDLKEGLPKVLVDKGKIQQVFINIFMNAIHAMPEGGTLSIDTRVTLLEGIRFRVGRRKVDGDYFEPGEKAVLCEVGDTGVGISDGHLDRIFDPFFSTKKPGEGTGLGLSVTKHIIDMHRGIIDVESKKGKGTRVTVILKIANGG